MIKLCKNTIFFINILLATISSCKTTGNRTQLVSINNDENLTRINAFVTEQGWVGISSTQVDNPSDYGRVIEPSQARGALFIYQLPLERNSDVEDIENFPTIEDAQEITDTITKIMPSFFGENADNITIDTSKEIWFIQLTVPSSGTTLRLPLAPEYLLGDWSVRQAAGEFISRIQDKLAVNPKRDHNEYLPEIEIVESTDGTILSTINQASWYNCDVRPAHCSRQRRTASGRVWTGADKTIATPLRGTLPIIALGTVLRITYNGRVTEGCVNDTGPMASNKIDLSSAVFDELASRSVGILKGIRVEVMRRIAITCPGF